MDLRNQLQTTLGTAYTLERELGGGGMSRVFVAEENALHRKVVVKVLPPELTAGVNVERFNREILLAAQLQHAHIVPVLAAGETNGLPYYTMPFVEGESLRVALGQKGPMSITDAISILRDVARALAYAHARGIVHRDIKPENVLIAGGSAVVTDFGIAKAISASRTQAPNATLTQVGTSLGTPAYMAPEQAAGDPATDHRADLYAFGCMAYELLAGRPPFVGKTPQRLLAAQMSETPQPLLELRPDTPAELADVIMRCLAKDADERPQAATDVVRVLDTVTSGGGHAAMPPILLGGRNSMWKALAIYAVAFVAVAILAKAAIVGIGLPSWVFPGALIVMALGLPVILFTAYVQRATRRMITMTPTYTPGGSAPPQGTMATIAMKASPHMSWRRTTIGGAYALGGFVLLIGAFMLMRAFGIGPFGSLLASGQLDAHQPLLVADFNAKGGADSSLGGVVAEAVRADLGQSDAVTVMSVSSIRDALQHMQKPVDSRIDADLAREIAKRNGLKAVVTGDITPVGAGFVITERVVAAESGNELATFQGTAAGPTDLIPTIGTLTRDLRGKIGESLKSVQNSPALADVTTGSLDALRAYTEALRYFQIADYQRAIGPLKQAVAFDSTFAEAWRKLGTAYYDIGTSSDLVDSAMTKAYRFRDHMTERERYATVGSYFGSGGPGNDRAKAIEAYRHGVALGDYAVSEHNLAILLADRRQFAAAESAYMDVAQRSDVPDAATFQQLGFALNTLGRYDAADSVADVYGKRRGAVAAMDFVRVVDLYGRGVPDSARAKAIAGDSASNPYDRAQMANFAGNVDAREGKLQSASARYVHANAITRAAGGLAPVVLDSVRKAFFDAWFLDRSKAAVQTLDAALAAQPLKSFPADQAPYALVASVYAIAGHPDRARALLAELDARVAQNQGLRTSLRPGRDRALGYIQLAENKPLDALRSFWAADSLPDGPADGCGACTAFTVGLAYDRANQPDSAIVEYQRFLTEPGGPTSERDGDDLALVYKSLGRLYEDKGDRANAATYYSKFVELWKNADPDLQPQVADVKQRLTHLKDTEKRP